MAVLWITKNGSRGYYIRQDAGPGCEDEILSGPYFTYEQAEREKLRIDEEDELAELDRKQIEDP